MLLDTDILVDLLRNHPPAVAWFRELPRYPQVSGVAALEILWGARTAAELQAAQRFLGTLPVQWPAEADAAQAAATASLHLSHGLDVMDALTAALALRCGLAVGTFNTKHLAAVPGVSTVQPYAR